VVHHPVPPHGPRLVAGMLTLGRRILDGSVRGRSRNRVWGRGVRRWLWLFRGLGGASLSVLVLGELLPPEKPVGKGDQGECECTDENPHDYKCPPGDAGTGFFTLFDGLRHGSGGRGSRCGRGPAYDGVVEDDGAVGRRG
jgi:hypothetical protein